VVGCGGGGSSDGGEGAGWCCYGVTLFKVGRCFHEKVSDWLGFGVYTGATKCHCTASIT